MNIVEDTPQSATTDSISFSWKTVLFNCDCHSFDQVIVQVVKAVNCSFEQAERFALEAHRKGSAVVYTGAQERCEAVAMVLEAIGLKTNVNQ